MEYKIGSPVVDTFVDRETERRKIREGINNNHFALIGLRRTGKTSLALKICEEMKEDMIPVYIDVSFIAPLTEKNFLKTFASEVVDKYTDHTDDKALSLKFKRFMSGAKDALVDILKGTRVSIGELAEVYFKSEEDLTEMLKVTMQLPEKLGEETGNDFIVVLDEFPRLLELNNDDFIWSLRSYIHRSESTHYIISGSAVSSMRYLLEKESPFFGTLLSIQLNSLEEDAVDEFMDLSDVDISESAKQKIKETTGMLPLYLQAFFHVADTRKLKIIREEEVEDIIEEVFDLLDTHFDYYLHELKGFKRTLLIEIASKDLHTAAQLSDVLEKTNNYVTTYLRRLENEGFLRHYSKGKYEMTDPFFKLWIRNHIK